MLVIHVEGGDDLVVCLDKADRELVVEAVTRLFTCCKKFTSIFFFNFFLIYMAGKVNWVSTQVFAARNSRQRQQASELFAGRQKEDADGGTVSGNSPDFSQAFQHDAPAGGAILLKLFRIVTSSTCLKQSRLYEAM